jgi:hypothetical protein
MRFNRYVVRCDNSLSDVFVVRVNADDLLPVDDRSNDEFDIGLVSLDDDDDDDDDSDESSDAMEFVNLRQGFACRSISSVSIGQTELARQLMNISKRQSNASNVDNGMISR